MTEIALRRLRNSRLAGAPFETPEDAVAWFGAVQSQDYAAAKWGIGQRTAATTDAAIDALFDAGRILRTHVLRPTWHFVLPADIRWLLALTGPRVKVASAYQYRQLELDERIFGRAHTVLVRAMEGGRQLTRPEIARAYDEAGVDASGLRLALLVMRAELDAVICSGPRRGRQFTYVLLEERVPPAPTMDRDTALAELASRYFASHGPAGAADFAWWSGLTVTDARKAIDAAGPRIRREEMGGRTFWAADGGPVAMAPDASAGGRRSTRGGDVAGTASPAVHLLPNYDELTVGYRDRSALLGPELQVAGPGFILSNVVTRDGRIVGAWRRRVEQDGVAVTVDLATPLDAAGRAALERAAGRYGDFLGVPVTLA